MNGKPDRIAVIVPIYNQERFLERTLSSLEQQTDPDFVALCVNDGSDDRSPGILESFSARDPRFVVIDKENGGLVSARNAALDRIMGMPDVKVVTFLDGDDFAHPQLLEAVRHYSDCHPLALVHWTYQSKDEANFLSRRYSFGPRRCREAVVGPNVWSWAFPKALIGDIRFARGTEGAEDTVFSHEVIYRRRPKVVAIPESLTFYAINPGSAMHREFTADDFVKRNAVLERMILIVSADRPALDRLCRNELPAMLKQFYKHLDRTRPDENEICRRLFVRELHSLRRRGLLRMNFWNPKYFRQYLRFCRLMRESE